MYVCMALFNQFCLKKGGVRGAERFINYFFHNILNKMATKTLNISIPVSMSEFLEENPTIKPSSVFQSAIENIQNSIKHNPQLIEANKENAKLRLWGQRIQEDLQKATEFITIKGLWEEFEKNV